MRVTVGRLGRPHGVNGQVTVEVRTDEPERRFRPGAVLHTDRPVLGSAATLTIRDVHWHGAILLLAFEGVVDRTTAESLRGTIVDIDVALEDRPEDPEEFYDHQLIGLRVRTLDGDEVGEVTQVVHLPAQDLLAVDHLGREVLIPFVTAIVPTIDLASRSILIDPPAGLLDEDAG